MNKTIALPLIVALVLAGLSSGCTVVGAIAGGFATPPLDDAAFSLTYEQLQELNHRTQLLVLTKEEIVLTGKYVKATPVELENPLSGVTIRAKGDEFLIPWGNIEKIEAKGRNIAKGVLIGLAAGAVIDIAVVILIISDTELDISPDWDSF
ncbi:hypothetical protein [Phaeodactylibacter sp.]|jgi:hypothetical protein|uniref:hypothetical protein n=1 Tax=Phaeodactylibacter sp. TaxID=1940289 RepID=UPI0025CE0806|nr:hypothetical protein [Phaeodactylibacter sp.]MCI4650073.1 hypothetical protein [Phaeodactylibacter sp.]MCI5091706.1 hypothetical protein [Phaeodactylibacter sp.]